MTTDQAPRSASFDETRPIHRNPRGGVGTAAAAVLVTLVALLSVVAPASAAPVGPERVTVERSDTPAWELYRYSAFRIDRQRVLQLRFVKIRGGAPMRHVRLKLVAETAGGATMRAVTRTDRNGFASWRLPQHRQLVFVQALFQPRRDHYVGDSLCRDRPGLRWRQC